MNDYNWGYRHHYLARLALGLALIAAIAIGFAFYFRFHAAPPIRYPGYYGPWPFYFFPFGWIFGLFLVFVIVSAVRWILWPRRGWGYRRGYWGYGEEYYILRQRYARGEITKEQFDQMTNDLRQHAETATRSQ